MPRVGDLRGHQIGTIVVVVAFLAAIRLFVTRMRLTPAEAAGIGAAWLVVAIAFEFGFGHFVDGLSWNRLLSDYDLTRGRLLLLLWLAVGAGPFLLAGQRARRAGKSSPAA